MYGSLSTFADGLEAIRRLHPSWPLSRLSVLLLIGTRQGVRMAEIERKLDLPQRTVWRHVAALEQEDGFVAAVPDPKDARALLVHLTRKGTAFLESLCATALPYSTPRHQQLDGLPPN